MTAVVPGLAGALIVAGILGIVAGLRPTAVPAGRPASASIAARLRAVPRRTRTLLLGGVGMGVVAWWVTGWTLALASGFHVAQAGYGA